jgi:hypothetical protein
MGRREGSLTYFGSDSIDAGRLPSVGEKRRVRLPLPVHEIGHRRTLAEARCGPLRIEVRLCVQEVSIDQS